jgi:hypothetical protein
MTSAFLSTDQTFDGTKKTSLLFSTEQAFRSDGTKKQISFFFLPTRRSDGTKEKLQRFFATNQAFDGTK